MPAPNPPAIPDPVDLSIIVVHVSEEDGRPSVIPAWLARELGEPIPIETVRGGY